jgi:hypothetical protein
MGKQGGALRFPAALLFEPTLACPAPNQARVLPEPVHFDLHAANGRKRVVPASATLPSLPVEAHLALAPLAELGHQRALHVPPSPPPNFR